MIYQSLNAYQIADELKRDEYANFTYEGAMLLADYLLDLSDETSDFEFDRVAIRCEWSELSESDLIREYGYLFDRYYPNQDEALGDLIELLRDRTYCIEFESNGAARFLIQGF